ncbi:glycyl-radical enzyme activating protein [Diplocloster modestus]|uniref:glycyl-radical enzyme activating protein n=1 Tax=Diplocloster modestus TaxID=2850322 RepID=UPI001EE92B1A|nr:glycyl-radical enzyme activating protein [Diplocloster modestus]
MEEIRGNVFDIQRYSIHDGDGIRTVIFLKGCPLRCRWCSNPESQSSKPQLFYSQSRCIRCLSCVSASTNGEITASDQGPVIHWQKCGSEEAIKLAGVCPADALMIKGQKITVEEVMQVIRRDRMFYERSGGGVTLSGGEPLLQPEFAKHLLQACREEGIPTAVETTGYVPWENIARILPCTDLFLYDFKSPDSEIHRSWTGVDNKRILQNLKQLQTAGANIHVRTPVIPGMNDKPETLRKMAVILDQLGITARSLLPFHQYGSGKYRSCGIPYSMEDVQQLSEERMMELNQVFLAQKV